MGDVPLRGAAETLNLSARDSEAPALTELSDADQAKLLADLGEAPYRLRQIRRWLYRSGATDYSQMTDLSISLREKLGRSHALHSLRIVKVSASTDGRTRKLLLQGRNAALIEAVLLPRSGGFAVCLSSQAGCGMACPFCATGRMGFRRNLSAAEIVDQYLLARALALAESAEVASVIFMGMGEPLANMDSVRGAIERLVSPEYCGMGARRITVSTIGLRDRIPRLAGWPWQIGLAISLHAPDDELRRKLVPPSRTYGIQDLMRDCVDYQRRTGRRVSYEYVMLRGVNDRPEHALELGKLLRGQICHVNLIPYNPVDGAEFRGSTREAVEEFRARLDAGGIPVTVRRPRGRDIDAACGQLAAKGT